MFARLFLERTIQMNGKFVKWLEDQVLRSNLLACDLAKKLRMSDSSISHYRHGRYIPRYTTVVALCRVLCDDPEYVWALIQEDSHVEQSHFSVWLRTCLATKNLNEADLAKRMGVSRQRVNSFHKQFRSHPPRLETLVRICTALGEDVDEAIRAITQGG